MFFKHVRDQSLRSFGKKTAICGPGWVPAGGPWISVPGAIHTQLSLLVTRRVSGLAQEGHIPEQMLQKRKYSEPL